MNSVWKTALDRIHTEEQLKERTRTYLAQQLVRQQTRRLHNFCAPLSVRRQFARSAQFKCIIGELDRFQLKKCLAAA